MFGLNNFVIAGKYFLMIAGELILIFVLVSFIIGVLTEYLPPSRIREFLSNRLTWVQYFLGSGLGALTPFCSCSTVPITTALLQGGVPFGPTMAFLFSSPVLNPVIIALLLSLLGYQVTVVYIIVTFFGSMATAVLLSKLGMESQVKPLATLRVGCCAEEAQPDFASVKAPSAAAGCCSAESGQSSTFITLPTFYAPGACCTGAVKATLQIPAQVPRGSVNFEEEGSADGSWRAPLKEKMKRASVSALSTFKGVFWYLMLGAGIGAFIYGFFPQDLVVRLAGPGTPWSIPVAAIIGVPMYIRAETMIPISAALVGKGMGVGTVLALIIGGAGASIPEIIILASMFKKKLIFAFVLNVFLVAIVAAYLVNYMLY
jgi:uncharacterized membrane protein YraQ (UPF0718 family)